MGGFPSGQRGQTVNLLLMLRWFESTSTHYYTDNGNRIVLARMSMIRAYSVMLIDAGVAELADAQDLKSCGTNLPYRFDSGRRQ